MRRLEGVRSNPAFASRRHAPPRIWIERTFNVFRLDATIYCFLIRLFELPPPRSTSRFSPIEIQTKPCFVFSLSVLPCLRFSLFRFFTLAFPPLPLLFVPSVSDDSKKRVDFIFASRNPNLIRNFNEARDRRTKSKAWHMVCQTVAFLSSAKREADRTRTRSRVRPRNTEFL